MKSKLKLSAVVAALLVTSMVSLRAQYGGAPGTAFPAAGVAPPVAFDPTTGLPIGQAGPDWKDANWKDPDITLTNVSFDNIPLSDVAKFLTDRFKEKFDVLLPSQAGGIAFINGQTVPTGWQHDWPSETINLRLKNLTASEIFSAMNLVFENNRTPLRWELKMNGHRQIALLRVLIDPTPQVDFTAPLPGQEKQRRIFFVGNLIGYSKEGSMTMEEVIKIVTDVWQMADVSGGSIKFHKDAQLLVVTGTPGQIDFMEQTLKALQQKVNMESVRSESAGPKRSVPTDK